MIKTDDIRIASLKPISSPAFLAHHIPSNAEIAYLVEHTRKVASDIIHGKDDRLLVVVGPCSIHDKEMALEYGKLLLKASTKHEQDLCIVMRVYFEKPRTRVGWKGLINDPHLDGSFDVDTGLTLARQLLVDLASMGVPAGCEFLDSIIPQYINDVVCWGAIGARTTESQVHRELASGLSMPIGFKNSTDGSIKIAVDALKASQHSHHFLSISKQGVPIIAETKGNDTTHVILRGSSHGPNYSAEHIAEAVKLLKEADLPPYLMVDCSHGNSQKQHERQVTVAKDLCEQMAQGSDAICGVMIESNLVAGNQSLKPKAELTYGQSITDACIDWQTTEGVLDDLAKAVQQRREAKKHG
jgi:3-deoxy-7-phosphoheptulonate synthase